MENLKAYKWPWQGRNVEAKGNWRCLVQWGLCLSFPPPAPAIAYEGVCVRVRGVWDELWLSSCFLSVGVQASLGAQGSSVAGQPGAWSW